MESRQLCWSCKNACGSCDWSRCFKPIKGWTAKKVQRKLYDTYRISTCPEYVPDKRTYSKEKKQKTMTTKDEMIDIKTMFDSGVTVEEIACILGRTDNAVRKALAKIERQSSEEVKAEKTDRKTSGTSRGRGKTTKAI